MTLLSVKLHHSRKGNKVYISHITFSIKDGEQNVFEDTVSKIVQIANAFPGCKYFKISVLVNEPTKYFLYEEWDSKQDADAFKASKERNDAVAHVASIMAAAPVTVGYTVESK